ncbi:MAG: glycosyltransferase [Gammaproteobacteria bacterium]|nr:glycosyltransferase [Gammaproteobacteria bacterium]
MKVSVVVPVYNDRRVGRALDSILSQQLDHALELIVVDAGSTDGTLDVVMGYADDISVLISEPDNGIFDGLNKGIRSTTGDAEDVVHYLGADDRYADPFVLRDVTDAFLEDAEVDACYGDLLYVNEAGRLVRRWHAGHFRRRKLYWGWLPPHLTLFLRRSVYNQHGMFDLRYRVSSDQDFMLRLLLQNGVSTRYLPRALIEMAPGGNSGTIGGICRGNLEAIRMRREHRMPVPYLVVPLRVASKVVQFMRLRL